MKTTETGVDLIKRHEGLRLKAYRCPAGVWTIGYGHTQGVKSNDCITPAQAVNYLHQDVAVIDRQLSKLCAERCVILNQNQWDALASWVFNLGINQLRSSTLWQRICQSPSHPDIPTQWLRWVYAGGRRLAGLENRRRDELKLYMS